MENEIKQAAYKALNTKYRVLSPASEARVIYRPFDPCRAVQVVAIVEWPATVAMRKVTLIHVIREGDSL
jgi:hypothetical protein